ncbi:YheC/YheD family protein [Bacillus sp. FJAT-50079]|uniref:YheC/YheD family protein n=1 Tax=Bacillus sp. FJAT-50079 TaxID=2833577 RepID=UPI001BC9AA42|nr:YheC/YheD family protein [Bacillus sp. FJAT-50079]MBS4210712.1 YheC/YheD family protein [Bacillus sp. FJAT-50079]
MKDLFPFKVFDDQELLFYYPRESEGKQGSKKIIFGSSVVEAQCSPHPNGRNVITISSELANQLQIPALISSTRFDSDEEALYLGPLVGIFTAGFSPFQLNPVGNRSSFFAKKLKEQHEDGAIAFLFGEQHIDWNEGLIKGYFFLNGMWEQMNIPFPQIVFDFFPHSLSANTIARNVKERFENDYLIQWYNPDFINELELFEKLDNDESIQYYLPETTAFQSFATIERMLADYGHVFIKSLREQKENKTIQIIYDRLNDEYYCRLIEKQERLLKFTSLEKLSNYVFRHSKLDELFVQQGIQLLRHDKQPIHFQINVCKEKEIWKVSDIQAKKREEHLDITEIFPAEEELARYKEKLSECAVSLSKAMEQQLQGLLNEFVVSLGIDKNEKVWILTATSKLAKPKVKLHSFMTNSF